MAVRRSAKCEEGLIEELRPCTLFEGLSDDEIQEILKCSGAEYVVYEENEKLIAENDVPDRIIMLIEGTVMVGRNTNAGKTTVINSFDRRGDILGEAEALRHAAVYDYFAQAESKCRVLILPRYFLEYHCKKECPYHFRLTSNMLLLVADHVRAIEERLDIINSSSLRQKICRMLYARCGEDHSGVLRMGRERMAGYLSAARPSLSRELIKMRNDGLIEVSRNGIRIADEEKVKELL